MAGEQSGGGQRNGEGKRGEGQEGAREKDTEASTGSTYDLAHGDGVVWKGGQNEVILQRSG